MRLVCIEDTRLRLRSDRVVTENCVCGRASGLAVYNLLPERPASPGVRFIYRVIPARHATARHVGSVAAIDAVADADNVLCR